MLLFGDGQRDCWRGWCRGLRVAGCRSPSGTWATTPARMISATGLVLWWSLRGRGKHTVLALPWGFDWIVRDFQFVPEPRSLTPVPRQSVHGVHVRNAIHLFQVELH